ncbi:glutathione S-transferase family protein [Halioxenophilus aromaticivorans]|uniref:Glutathione S-transferase N-terminal domain-containing protein n=1 Tax=Halioxenophilus aromaticivorans TaxID=1306992 RepID=A0AAV3U105_9ALTE
MKIYSFATFNLTKLLYTAQEVGQTYELVLYSPEKMQHKSPEHLARHPLGKVPAVEYNGQTLFESNAICRLMAELNDNKLYGSSPMARAKVNQWVDFITLHYLRPLSTFAWEEGIRVHYFGQKTDQQACQAAQKELDELLPVLDRQIGDNAFFLGNDISLADTVGFALLQIESFTSLDISANLNLQRWYQAMAQRPSVQKALEQLPGRGIFSFTAKS